MLKLCQLIYLMLPAYFANMAPPFVRFWRGWNRPISERRLGAHKTVLGFAAGVTAAVIVAYAQAHIGWSGSLMDYSHWWLIGLSLGFGAMAGDSIKSYFKRMRAIAPGRSWLFADQLDFVVGALVMLSLWVRLMWLDIFIILVVSFLADIAVNHIAYALGIRDTKW